MAMTSEEQEKFLETMRKRREVGEAAELHNRERAIKITDFVYPTDSNGQWPDTLFSEREKRGLPSLTINRLPAFGNQVIGDHLTNRPQIKVKPADMDADQQGASNREGIIRHTEQVSRAKFIIDQAYKTMCASGYPAHWQINTRFVSGDSFDQEIIWEAIENQFSVLRDPHAKENDGRDANWLFILETISRDEWERRYPGKEIPISAGATALGTEYANWFDDKTVTIAVYWTRKSKKRTLCAMDDGRLAWKDELSAAAQRHIKQKRESESWTVEVSKCTGTEILEDPKEKPWTWIPVVSCIPPYIIKEGKKWYRSIYEDSIDPQRFYNYWKSLNVTHIKPKPPYVTAAMIKNHKPFWDRKDKTDFDYLPIDWTEAGWPHDAPPPQVSTAIVQEEQSAIEDVKATMGMWNPSLGATEQSLSGKAIGKLQMAGDKGNMEYVNSLVQALTFTGDLILDMNPHVHDTEGRLIPVLSFDGTPGQLRINNRRQTAEGEVIENDMKAGKYRCVVDVGPSFTTQRQEALDAMTAFSQGNPEIAAVLAPFMAKFSDWPYADRIFNLLKALQPPNLQALYDEQQPGEDGNPVDPRIVQMQAQFESQLQQVQQALEQLQAENQSLKQQEAVKMAELQANTQMSAEKLALEREKAQQEIALKRETAQADFELRMKEIMMKDELESKKATAELLHKEKVAAMQPKPEEKKESAA